MITKLVRLADLLDEKGFYKEANMVDEMMHPEEPESEPDALKLLADYHRQYAEEHGTAPTVRECHEHLASRGQ